MNCPHCGKPINIGALLGAQTSDAKAEAARRNGAKGGRPRKPKRVARRSNDQAQRRPDNAAPSATKGNE